MKHSLIIASLLFCSTALFAQDKHANDASYSRNNYKHPNKAEYARKNNLDNSFEITTRKEERNEDYKHTFSGKKESSKASIESRPARTNRSYKHPYGI